MLYLHLLALLGIVSISFSAIFVRLASVSPVTATFFRAAYAVPALALLWIAQRSKDGRGGRERAIAVASGVVLALDLTLWHESIALVGAGLGTVIANVQVVFVAAAAWRKDWFPNTLPIRSRLGDSPTEVTRRTPRPEKTDSTARCCWGLGPQKR